MKKADAKKLSDTSMMTPLYRRVVVDDSVGVAVETMAAPGRRGGGDNRRDRDAAVVGDWDEDGGANA